MDSSQFFCREITINKTFEQTYDYLLQIPTVKYFVLESENKTFGKVIYRFLNNKIEVLAEKAPNDQTKLRISVMDKNGDYYTTVESAGNDASNFENALSLLIEGKPEEFMPNTGKVATASGCVQIILGLVAVSAIVYVVYLMFIK